MAMIDRFDGPYRFLSNFWPCQIVMDKKIYASIENAFQAAKTLDPRERVQFQHADLTPGQAKRLGRKVTLRPAWDHIRVQVMEDLVRQKFQDPDLQRLLLDTGDSLLVEGNTWGDTFWGCVERKGRNHLGRILMKVRQEIQEIDGRGF